MPRLIENETFLTVESEIPRRVEEISWEEQEPSAEVLGTLVDLNRTKKATRDAHQYTLRG